jgi:hypothetical protein
MPAGVRMKNGWCKCHEAQHTSGAHSMAGHQPTMRMLNMSIHHRHSLLSEQEIGVSVEVLPYTFYI